jgi:hypothetical protein
MGCISQGVTPCLSATTNQDDSCSTAPSSSWRPPESSAPSASVEDDSIVRPGALPRPSPKTNRDGARKRRGGAQMCTQAGTPQQQRPPTSQTREAERPGGERFARKVPRHSEAHKVSALWPNGGCAVIDSKLLPASVLVQLLTASCWPQVWLWSY